MVWARFRNLLPPSLPQRTLAADVSERRGVAITICLLISILVWFLFKMQETFTDVLEVPTTVVNLPADQALEALPPSEVRVQVQAEGFQLLRLRFDPPLIQLDASQETINLAEETRPQLPGGVQLENVSPQQIQLHKEPLVERTIPIQLRADIHTARAHALVDAPQIEPDSVAVSGAESIVNGLVAWPTERIERENLSDTLVAVVPLADTLTGLVSLSHSATTMRVVAQPFTEATRTIEVQVEDAPTNEELVRLFPSSVQVSYSVLLSDYEESLTAPNFMATVSFEEIRSDTTGRVTPRLILPSDLVIRNARMTPSSLRFYYVLSP